MYKLICLLALVIYCQARYTLDANQASYPASGYRPMTSFNLPPKYLPPSTQERYSQGLEPQIFEISQQQVDYLGSDYVSLAPREPHKNYVTPLAYYPQQQQQQQQQTNFVNKERNNNLYRQNSYNGKSTYDEEKLSANTGGDLERKETLKILNAALQYYRNNYNNKSNNKNENINENENVNVNKYNNLQENNNVGIITQGKYYVLTPDNVIQRVSYLTTQDDMEAKTNDFKAQLKYTNIGELNEPLYKYNELGQLVRLVK